MKKKKYNTDQHNSMPSKKSKYDLKAYPVYPPEEDIYIQALKESDITPEDISKTKGSKEEEIIEIDKNEDSSDMDLNIPGSELDDAQEIIGSEDEENNYYSLGGDDHNNLDEN
ncbi:MAG: hypothetical protein VB110_07620 [Bacteroidales bacterium]|nr:hypothetical protein [Bacteroidales bacterium]